MSLASCSSDDDEDNGGNANVSAILGGEAVSIPYAYWYFDEDSYVSGQDTKLMVIEFFSYEITNMSAGSVTSGSINFMSIDFEVPKSQTKLLPATVESKDYSIYFAQNVNMTNSGWQGETDYRATSNSPVVITKDGDKFSITIAEAEIYGGYEGDDYGNEMKQLKFSYTGNIALLPEDFYD